MTPIPPHIKSLREKVGSDLLWLPGVTCIVLRDGVDGPEVLLQHRADTDEWNPICGCIDPGEDPDVCAVREVEEEAGIDVEVVRLLGVMALDVHVLPNGHQVQYYDTAVLARPVGDGEGAHVADDESHAIRWVPVDDLPPMEERFLHEIRMGVEGVERPYFGAEHRPA